MLQNVVEARLHVQVFYCVAKWYLRSVCVRRGVLHVVAGVEGEVLVC